MVYVHMCTVSPCAPKITHEIDAYYHGVIATITQIGILLINSMMAMTKFMRIPTKIISN
jgi:hypothetical protein